MKIHHSILKSFMRYHKHEPIHHKLNIRFTFIKKYENKQTNA